MTTFTAYPKYYGIWQFFVADYLTTEVRLPAQTAYDELLVDKEVMRQSKFALTPPSLEIIREGVFVDKKPFSGFQRKTNIMKIIANKQSLLSFLIILMLTLSAPMALAQDDDTTASAELDASIAWLIDQQQPDGGWTDGFSAGSGPTADAVFALASAEVDVHTVESTDGNTALDFLETYLSENEDFTGAAIAKTIIALVAAGEDPTTFADVDLVTWLLDTQDEDGVFVDDMTGIFGHCLITIAIYNADGNMMEETNAESIEAANLALTTLQNEDGGFGFAFGSASDTNTTAVCLQALAISEEEEIESAIGAALEYLGQIQNEDGGWPYQNPSDFGTDSDTNSTSLVAQALIATDVDPDAWNTEDIATYLLSLQNDSGAFGFNAGFADDNFLSTVAIIPVLADTLLTDAWFLSAEEVMEGES